MRIIDRVRATLDEDIQSGDITANLLLKSFQHVEATILCKDIGYCRNPTYTINDPHNVVS